MDIVIKPMEIEEYENFAKVLFDVIYDEITKKLDHSHVTISEEELSKHIAIIVREQLRVTFCTDIAEYISHMCLRPAVYSYIRTLNLYDVWQYFHRNDRHNIARSIIDFCADFLGIRNSRFNTSSFISSFITIIHIDS